MTKGRAEAFSDGVIAIIITIMVLELKVPHGADDWAALRPVLPVFGAYVLSFLMVAIYWSNHHHMFHATHHIDGGTLWANTHLLFWLSLIPVTTAWVGDSLLAPVPTALYGVVLLMCGVAYTILQRTIIAHGHMTGAVAQRLGMDKKGLMSLVLYAVAIPSALAGYRTVAGAIYVGVALWWLIPDRRIEKGLVEEKV